jgi:hypothetical protein
MSRRSIFLILCPLVLLLTTRPLPAPISEVPETTPIPKPNKEVIPRPKPKPKAVAKPRATPSRSFAGTWSGNVIASSSTGESGSYSYTINISDDEKTVWINWNETGQPISGPGHQAPCNRFRETLTWSLTFPESTVTDTLRIDANGNGSFVREGAWTSGDNQGVTYNQTGTLSRQGASSAPSGPQTTAKVPATTPITTTASKSVGDLPIAKPVPNKPGYVYDPFDPNTKVILDCRGKASGTKLKDPFSGKLFVVP